MDRTPHVSPLARRASSSRSPGQDGLSLGAMAERLAGLRKADGGHAYHVTYYRDLGSIESDGLSPGGGGAMGRGGYSGHSRGRLFMTEEAGLPFWYGRMEEHANDLSDDPLEEGYVPVVLRFPEPEETESDEPGTRDAMAESFYSEEGVGPDDIEIFDGNSWIPLADWEGMDPSAAFETDEFDGEVYHVFRSDSPLLPR
jgi:hypothetical protein